MCDKLARNIISAGIITKQPIFIYKLNNYENVKISQQQKSQQCMLSSMQYAAFHSLRLRQSAKQKTQQVPVILSHIIGQSVGK